MIDVSPYDFVDFGCSNGNSMTWFSARFGAERGLGVDIDTAKVERAKAAGRDAAAADLTVPGLFEGKVRFSGLSHFLEHLPSVEHARRLIDTAISISRDFVYIRQPWFDSDGYLARQGFKLFWSDWRGHPLPLTSWQMIKLFRPFAAARRIGRFVIYGRQPVLCTDDKCVVPLAAPVDGFGYEPAQGFKPSQPLDGVFYELIAIALIDKAVPLQPLIGSDFTVVYDSRAALRAQSEGRFYPSPAA